MSRIIGRRLEGARMLTLVAILAAALAVAIAIVLVYAATRPDAFVVRRETSVAAPAERVFALVNDFHRWSAWSPYEKMDPAMTRAYSGQPSGIGAIYQWTGNSKVGAGRMEILEATSPGRIAIKLDFIKPFEGHNTAEFTMEPDGGATKVVWAMRGSSPFVMKVMSLFLNMDRLVGRDFETGLANIKQIVEK
jgi:uncharacterized protein YndB with AHSA1/START domain